MADIGTFTGIGVALLIAHTVADHWVQSERDAATKGQRDHVGRLACARHVASYTAVTALTVAVLWSAFRLDINWLGFAAGQLVSAVTHYWADRRFTLSRLATAVGHAPFYGLGAPRGHTVLALPDGAGPGHPGERVPLDNLSLGTGAYALDQSWHWGWLGVAAFLTAVL